MNLGDARVVLRPRSLPDVIDLTLRVCHSTHLKAYAIWSSLTLLPAFLLCVAARVKLGWEWLGVWLLAVVLAGVLQGVFTIGASRLLFSREVSTGQVLGRFLRRLPSYLLTLLILRVVMVCSFVLAPLVPFLPFVHEASLLEDASLRKAMSRTQKLTQRSLGRVIELALFSLAALAAAVVGAEVIGHTLASFVLEIQTPLGSLWEEGGSVFALAGLFIAVPYLATLRFLTYIDLRTRKEGWDLQLELSAIRAGEKAA